MNEAGVSDFPGMGRRGETTDDRRETEEAEALTWYTVISHVCRFTSHVLSLTLL
jgi:hypothetical protein